MFKSSAWAKEIMCVCVCEGVPLLSVRMYLPTYLCKLERLRGANTVCLCHRMYLPTYLLCTYLPTYYVPTYLPTYYVPTYLCKLERLRGANTVCLCHRIKGTIWRKLWYKDWTDKNTEIEIHSQATRPVNRETEH